MKIKEIIVTTADLAELFGVADKYISQLVLDHGMPKEGHNQFNLFLSITWYLAYRDQLADKRVEKIKADLSQARSRKDLADADLKELELAEKREALIPFDIVRENAINKASIYVKSLMQLETKLIPLLEQVQDKSEFGIIIRKEIEKIRNQVADIPSNARAEDISFN